LASGQFRWFLATAVGGVVVAAVLVGLLFRAGSSWRKRRRPGAQQGSVMVEFALLLMPLLVISLVIIQSSLLMGGHLCVTYAGYCAARSAIVQIPRETLLEPANTLVSYSDPYSSDKLRMLKWSAVWAVMPVSDGGYEGWSDRTDALARGLEEHFGSYGESAPDWVRGHLGKKLAYAEDHTEIRLEEPDNKEAFTPHENLTVSVRHDLYLSVPYAGWLLATLDRENSVRLEEGKYALRVTTHCTLPNEGENDWIEKDEFP
jgi:hypothetical protein